MSSELARNALEAAPDAMVIIDSVGTVRFANRQTAAMFAYSYEQIVGHSIEQLLPERFRARHIEHRKEYWSNERVRPMGAGLELFGRRQDGTEFPVEISLSPVQDGEEALVAAAIRDVSERKQAEAELIAARQTADRARAIAVEARESADRANQGKSRFLATASHDLRQPLQTLALLNGALRRIVSEEAATAAIAQQEQAINAMSRLLNALLDISKLESGAIKPEPTDFVVAGLFEEMRREFADIAASKGLRFEIDICQDQVHSDPSLVEQALRNLLSNALKYTRDGFVRLRCLHVAQVVRIEVLDTGIGIPRDQLPYICDEFYQVGVAANSSRDGYGLGLSIVHRIVSLLGIKLDVQSELGKGSTFALELPAGIGPSVTSAAPPTQAATGPGAASKKPRVLLVEDDPGVRASMRLLLRVEGYDVVLAANLAEALDAAHSGASVDFLITDYHLEGGETGIQVIEALRARFGPLRAVLMTGDTSTEIRDLPRDPSLRVASKPLKADEILTLLRELSGS
jgi:PAS domain S-box-containing protein